MLKKHNYKQRFLNKLFALLLIVFCTSSGWAQQFTLGLKGGPLMTWPGFGDKEAKDVFGRKIKPGFAAGFLIGFPLKNSYSLILEGGYSQRKRTLTFINNGDWQNIMTFQMADMSMLLRRSFKFMLWRNIPAEGFFNLGPEINYWFDVKGNLKISGEPYKVDVKVDEERTHNFHYMYLNDVNRWLFGIGLGAGLRAPLKRNHHLLTEVRFVSGHTFLGTKESAYINIHGFNDTFKTNLKTLTFSVAYTVDIDVRKSRMGKSTVKETNKSKSKKKR